MKLYSRYGEEKMEIAPTTSCTETKGIMEDHLLQLSFSDYRFVEFDVNDYIDLFNERFTVTKRYAPEQSGNEQWRYNLSLSGVQSLFARYLVIKNTAGENELIFSLTATAADHLALIVDSVNSQIGESLFSVGAVVDTEYITIDYSGTTAAEAFATLASMAETEWWRDGYVINLSRCVFGSNITLGLMNGLTKLYPDSATNVELFTRLYPVGSERNIRYEDYGHTRLQLPDGQKYVDKGVELYGVMPKMEQERFADIYPRRVGAVTSVRTEQRTGDNGEPFTIYFFKDDELTFNPNDYNIEGLVKKVTFESGELNGRDFEVNYNSDTKEFEIITQWPYDNDIQVPGATLIPKVGDEYALWNLRMPLEYYTLAENEFKAAVDAYMGELYNDVTVYKAHTDYIHIEHYAVNVDIGQRVRLESDFYFADGYRDSRIVRYTRSVLYPTDYDIDISDVLSKGTLTQLEGEIEDVKDDIKETGDSVSKLANYTERGFAQATETAKLLINAALAGFSGSISPITIRSMQLLIGGDSLQFDFVDDKESPSKVSHLEYFDNVTKQFKAEAGLIQHKTIGITSISPTHAPSEYRYWSLPAYTSAVITDDTKPYYVYIKADKASEDAVFMLSLTPIEMEEVDGYYHLLCGLLNSVIDGSRSYASMYGFTLIEPGRIVTDVIQSSNFNIETFEGMLIDLVRGRIIMGRDAELVAFSLTLRAPDGSDVDAYGAISNAQTSADEANSKLEKVVPVNIYIDAENGNITINGVGENTLTATVFYGIIDITADQEAWRFSWTRRSDDKVGDALWNSQHVSIGNVLSIDDDDIYRSAKIECLFDYEGIDFTKYLT